MRQILIALLLVCSPVTAFASCPSTPSDCSNISFNNAFAGGKIQGAASTTSRAPFNLPPGTDPTSPTNGDVWYTTSGLFARIAGVTVALGGGGGGGTPGGSNGQVQYNNAGSFGGLNNAQLTTYINPFSSSLSGSAPASGGGTTNFLRADGTWTTPSGGGNVTGPGSATANDIVTFNGTSGHIIKDSGVTTNTLQAVANVLDYAGGTTINTCANDATSAIQAAINTTKTVYIPKGCYKITSDITITQKSQIIYGDGIGCYTLISTAQNCTSTSVGTVIYGTGGGFTNGFFVYTPGLSPFEPGPAMRDLAITAAQPDTATRGSLNNYPTFIKALSIPRFRLDRVRLSQCIVCLDMRGNSGGAFLNDVQVSGYGNTTGSGGALIQVDGSLDSVRMQGLEVYNFDMSANQVSIMTNAATVGLSSGRMDDLVISNSLFLVGTSIEFFYGTGGDGSCGFWPCGSTFGTITGTGFDTYNGIVAQAAGGGVGPTLNITGSYFNCGNPTCQAIVATAGTFTLSAVSILDGGGSGTGFGNSLIALSSGSGALSFNWASGYSTQGAENRTVVYVGGTAAANINLSGITFLKAVATYTQPVIYVDSGPRANIVNNYINDTTGSSPFVHLSADGFHIVTNNSAPGWSIQTPIGATIEIVTCNALVGSSNACGSSGGGGVTSWNGQTGSVTNGIQVGSTINTDYVTCFKGGQSVGNCETGNLDSLAVFQGLYPVNSATMFLGKAGNVWTDVVAAQSDTNVINYYVSLNNLSDARRKQDVTDEPLGLDFIRQLNTRTFRWKQDDQHDAASTVGVHHGLIAQEVKMALNGRPFAGLTEPTEKDDNYYLSYTEFVSPLIKAAQELDTRIRILEGIIGVMFLIMLGGGGMLYRRMA